MAVLTLKPASEKQVGFLRSLMERGHGTDELRDEIALRIEEDTLDSRRASDYIDVLLKTKPTKKSGMQELLSRVPKSKYAIPAEELELSSIETKNDLLFVEVKEYMGTLYMRQLHGSVGDFNRSKLETQQVRDVLEIIASDPYKYARTFGKHHACCGSCGAELTDARSRELQLGPECRKKFGF